MTYIIKNVNIFELTRQIFGITANVYTGINLNQQLAKYDASKIAVIEPGASIGTSVLDTPIFETLAIKHPLTGEMIYFEDAPLMEVSCKIDIVKSKVNKRPGTVKEYITRDDYRVGIKGLLVNHTGEDLPHDKMRDLNELLIQGVAVEVESRLLNALGIYNLVVEDFKFNPNGNYTNVAPYTWMAVSDDPIELDLDTPVVKDTASFQTTIL